MKLLTIECGDSKLPSAITLAADKIKPKPQANISMNVDVERFSVPAFKNELFHWAPDIIVLDPPAWEPNLMKWGALLAETIRHTTVVSGRLVFVSGVDVLGDSQLRTEGAIAMPFTDRGEFLHTSEMLIETSLSSHYIMRFPNTIEDYSIRGKAGPHTPLYRGANERFTIINLEDMAKCIIEKAQTGWYGKYHVTPNDSLILSEVINLEYDKTKRIPDYSLASKYDWPVSKSKDVWDKLVKEVSNDVNA